MRIAMYGGTFNPIHRGHMNAAAAVVAALDLEKLLLMPAGIPPHKALPEGSASPAQRLEMCRLAAAALDKVEVSSIELERTGPSYTVDTLNQLRETYPEARLWLVVGTDMVLSFDRWRQPERMAKLCRLAVVARDEQDRQSIAQKAAELRESLGLQVDIIHCPALPMSSTQVRESLDPALLHPSVAAYVAEHRLYLPTLEHLRADVEKRVSSKRMAHILGCETLAAQMAQAFGLPDYDARAAAILHDCTKALDEKEQLTLCEKWHIILDYGEDDLAALVHADTGAETALRVFKMPGAIADAIRTHTTGDVCMTALQKVLYVADLCEYTRTWPGVEQLRQLALTDLDRAYAAALRQTVSFIRSQGREPYYKSLDALNAVETEDKEDMDSKQLMETIVKIADSKKARDIVVLQVDDKTTLTDYFVIMTGTSNTHIRALGDEIEFKVKEELEILPHHHEGVNSNWVLVDYTGVVVNVFQQEAREMYALERLWGDGTKIDLTDLIVKED